MECICLAVEAAEVRLCSIPSLLSVLPVMCSSGFDIMQLFLTLVDRLPGLMECVSNYFSNIFQRTTLCTRLPALRVWASWTKLEAICLSFIFFTSYFGIFPTLSNYLRFLQVVGRQVNQCTKEDRERCARSFTFRQSSREIETEISLNFLHSF